MKGANVEPWIGDATTEAGDECNFSAGALGDGPKCQQRATRHVLSESAMHGLVALTTCDVHAPIARSAGVLNDEHAYGPGCSGLSSLWTQAGYCLPDASGDAA